ncbi:MAG: hypothetical protein Q7T57_01525 [Dehalococcoidales bacterium]|nr:hypothetical protein [Dehalococcoidales bacterium]
MAAVGLAIGGGIAALITSLLMLGDASLLNVYLTLAFGCVSLVGTVLYRVDRSLRRERLKSAVVAEDAHYNGPTRAAQLHSPPPLRWTVGTAHGNCEEGVSILIIL